jgi:hypothetical protein
MTAEERQIKEFMDKNKPIHWDNGVKQYGGSLDKPIRRDNTYLLRLSTEEPIAIGEHWHGRKIKPTHSIFYVEPSGAVHTWSEWWKITPYYQHKRHYTKPSKGDWLKRCVV